MSVLVAVASRHGATQEIAEEIGKVIHQGGFAVDVVKLTGSSGYGPLPDPAQYDAVVIGSAIYMGRWLGPARDFVANNIEVLTAKPVWAFSSGPIGEAKDAASAGAADQVTPVDQRTFGGRLERDGLGFAERALVTVMRTADEDDRDWPEIRSWAEGIARTLTAQNPSTHA
jgi:menaquinone-dependent protoporphyrinogen oxidase